MTQHDVLHENAGVFHWTCRQGAPRLREPSHGASRGFSIGSPWMVALALTAVASCGAVYPELRTSVRDVDEGDVVGGTAPRQMAYIEFERARVPPRAPDGRPWSEAGDELPDPVARLIVDGRTLIETPVEEDTLTPTWPNQRRANYRLRPRSRATVQLLAHGTMNDRLICAKNVGDLRAEAELGRVELVCDNGARIWLLVQPARPKFGLGLFYELRINQVFVSLIVEDSPAGRAGLRVGDEIIALDGKWVRSMDEAQVRSMFNAGAANGLRITVRTAAGPREVVVKEGPVYLSIDDSEIWGADARFEE
ncbi:MAG: PDZ domain-containing protein [Polyangiaceae bacterium]|nr:PDZ domain-containing protein [Polyangiaceae bacterium]